MDLLLFGLGLLGFIIGIVLLIVGLIKKKKMKAGTIIGVSFALCAIGLLMPTDNKEVAKDENEELPKVEEKVKEDESEEVAEVEDAQDPVEAKEVVEVTPTTAPVITWQSKITEIANGSGTENEKFDAVMLFAKEYTTNQPEAEQFRNELINDFKSGKYLSDIKNHEYMLSSIFKTRIVETYYLFQTSPIKDFAFDMQQNLKYTYRGVDAVDSEVVKSNEHQMEKALKKIE